MRTVKYISRDIDHQSDSETFWFGINGEGFGICRKSGSDDAILDSDGHPITPQNGYVFSTAGDGEERLNITELLERTYCMQMQNAKH